MTGPHDLPPTLAPLIQAVQTNCHIADARHARDLTLCTYLLQMREFHRWERGLPFSAPLPRAEVGEWIAQREALWARHEGSEFERLRLPGRPAALDPFDTEAINAALAPCGLLYGAGLLEAERPVFFIARQHSSGRREGLRVQQAGRELARGLAAPPAALAAGADGPIVLRRESMARACWERYEAFALRPAPASAFAAMLEAYGFGAGFEAALPRWLDDHAEVALLHELGEYRAGQRLGPRWAALRQALPTRCGRLMAAAVRDHLADLGNTLPALLDRGAAACLHAWFADYDGWRETLFPGLAGAYREWRRGDGGRALRSACDHGLAHFDRLAQRLLDQHAREGDTAAPAIEQGLAAAQAVCGWAR